MAKTQSVEFQVQRLLNEYNEGVKNVVETSAEETAEFAKNQLRSTSPKDSGRRRHYANGWAAKREGNGLLVSYRVYNKTKPGLTHLLENGHVIRNAKGTFGRVRPIKHIAPVEEAASMKFELRVKARLRSLT